MPRKSLSLILAAALSAASQSAGYTADTSHPGDARQVLAAAAAASANTGETSANTMLVPGQILHTGIDLEAISLSHRSMQLSDQIGLTPLLRKIEHLRALTRGEQALTLESLAQRQELTETVQEAQQLIQEAELAIDFTVAQINAEHSVYEELLGNFRDRANRAVQVSNWASYYSNGALWAIGEALAIPSAKRPKYAISSGIFGIIAGVTPSFFSLYGMHAAGGKKYASKADPNMLAKLFDLKPDLEDEYPKQVWNYLNSVPPGDATGKTRRDQIIDRWVADKNIPDFTDRKSAAQVDLLAGMVDKNKALTISILETRETMLSQLAAEVLKMKRPLLELSMAVHGEKHLEVSQ